LALSDGSRSWHALWTQSHCEQLVHDQLHARGFTTFLPKIRTWSRRRGVQRLIPVPMFPGYLFVQHAIDKTSYVEIAKTRGLVRILGERWDRPTTIADAEVDSLQRLAQDELEVMPHPYLCEGQRVRITAGLLAGLQGILLRTKAKRGLLVLSVDLIHQSVAVEIDCTAVVPLASATAQTPAA
jgi:transcription termination/antitermination protein NusG